MVSINFLPWREYLLVYQRKSVLRLIAVSILISMAFLMGMHQYLSEQVQNLQEKITTLQIAMQRNKQLAENNKNEWQTMAALFSYQKLTNTLFLQLSQSFNPSICFFSIERKDKQIIFLGRANSIEGLTTYLNQWPGVENFSEIKIEEINQTINDPTVEFRLRGIEN